MTERCRHSLRSSNSSPDVPGVSPKTAWRLVQDTGAVGRDELLTALAAPAPRGLPEEGEGSLQAIRDHLSARIPGAR